MADEPWRELRDTSTKPSELQGKLRHIERVSLRHAHKFIIRRLVNLREVRRHALSWVLLIAILSGAAFWQSGIAAQTYTAQIPANTGIYTEGDFGTLDNLNPIFASSPAERSAARLLFANLFSYDDQNDLVGELADHYSVDTSGKVYTVHLRQSARWQDGAPITADDVVFTINLIKDADTGSPLYESWRNVSVAKVDQQTVNFTLPSPYAPFANSLVVAILPQHVLKDVAPSELRTAPYNRAPTVASGPFAFQDLNAVDQAQTHYLLRMKANADYVLGQPKLSGFQLHAYKDSDDLVKAFRTQEVAASSDMSLTQLKNIGGSFTEINAPLFNGVYAFLKTDNAPLTDAHVRQALQLATDQPSIIKQLDSRVQPLEGPLLPGQPGYQTSVRQPTRDLAKARSLLDAAGWKVGPGGVRQKDGQPLRLRLVTVSTGDYPNVAQEVMNEWQQIGVSFDSSLVKPDDLQQNVIVPRAYDVLIYEVAIGRDPDVFAYWDSSQATQYGLNLSNYKSTKVDDDLESARTNMDQKLRDAKYHAFVQQWLSDVPAVALYRPAFNYVENKNTISFTSHALVDPTDRFFNVRYWAAGYQEGRPTR